ncbi:MAG TPA: alpha/beta hydrolase [Longimicrobiales bacterium]
MIEQRIEVAGRITRYIEAGSGPPIIFAAGLGISADFYKPNMAALAHAGFRANTPDLPGFGKTRGPLFGASVSHLADHLTGFAQALGIKHAGWIGHSLGCQPLLRIAGRHPELVDRMVLAGPTGGYERRRINQIGALASAAVHEPWRLMKAVLRDYLRLSPFNYVGVWLKAAEDDPLLSAKLVNQRALILVGTRDKVPRPEFLASLSALLKADVVKLAGGNHGLPLDAQPEFDQAVIEFMRRGAGV